jgi:hypothetical protein
MRQAMQVERIAVPVAQLGRSLSVHHRNKLAGSMLVQTVQRYEESVSASKEGP